MPKLKAGTIVPTETEENAIIHQAKTDGTLLSDAELKEMRPIGEFSQLQTLAKRGRPRKASPKKSTTIRLNAEVVGFFKQQGKGWQTEINDILQKYVDTHRSH